MRSISSNGLAQLAQRYGGEPIYLIEIDWADVAAPKWYADRDMQGIPGKILQVSDLDNVINVLKNSSSQDLEVTLDDTDGSIKQIMDAHDVQGRTVRVYQYFSGLALVDKFLLFAGRISTPITWSERDRTFKCTILSRLEDKEIGFSAEEGQFPLLPADLVGKVWPMVFGKVFDVPALQIKHAVTGITMASVGALAGAAEHLALPIYDNGTNHDPEKKKQKAEDAIEEAALECLEGYWRKRDDGRADEYARQREESESKSFTYVTTDFSSCIWIDRQKQVKDAEKATGGHNPLRVLGGTEFPQRRVITLDINGCLFTGFFRGEMFHIQSRYWPDGDAEAKQDFESRRDNCNRVVSPAGQVVTTSGETITTTGGQIIRVFWAEAGATVRMHSAEPLTYIVAITPGTGGISNTGVFAVKAFKQFVGQQGLVNVPRNLYRVEVKNYGSITAVQVVLKRALSSVTDGGWSDDIYVTYQSSIGPNIVDILKYLIDNYTDLDYDTTTFNAVATKLTAFPANFPLLERKNAITVLQEIAYQARCALWISNGVFYLKYLPEEPEGLDVVDTITVSDIDAENSLEVDLTPTEDLVTKMTVKWRMSWAPGASDREKDKSEKTLILRHNITRYGVHAEDYNWYIYNQPDTVLKCATFWLIRKSHTWKRVKFKTFLHKLNLETLDCVTFDASGYVASGPVKMMVEKATYNSADNLIDFECLVPVRAGTMSPYDLYWPAQVVVDHTWPPQADIDSGDAGGGGIGQQAVGALPIGYTELTPNFGGTVYVAGPNVIFPPFSDWGDTHPTDLNFVPQPINNPTGDTQVPDSEPRPSPNTRPKHAESTPPRVPRTPTSRDGSKGTKGTEGLVIDIANTTVIDSSEAISVAEEEELGAQCVDESRRSTFKTIFHGITDGGQITLRMGALVAHSGYPDGGPLSDVFAITERQDGVEMSELDGSMVEMPSYRNQLVLDMSARVAADNYPEGAALNNVFILQADDANVVRLCNRTNAYYSDAENSKEFDFRFDTEGEKWGAGTAFLKPE